MAGHKPPIRTANIVGSGPNGLAAAITLAQAGVRVTVYEANPQIGGACSTAEITLPGFHHDLGASAFPMGIASPFFRSLPLESYGFRWTQPELALAHPLADGTAVCLQPALDAMTHELGEGDGAAWQRLFAPIVRRWQQLIPELLGPILHVPQHPVILARFGIPASLPAVTLADMLFQGQRARALFAGCAAHSVMPLTSPLTASVGLIFVAAGHTTGWPVSHGGAQSLSNALAAHLQSLGGEILTDARITNLADIEPADLTMFDTSTRALDEIAADRLTPSFRKTLQTYRQGPGIFKIDWALSQPIPWLAPDCRRAATVHLGGTLEEIARSEEAAHRGRHSDRPFVLLVQPSICDPSRAPAGQHTAWAYCHVPNGSALDRTQAIEDQVERYAPGFHDCVHARKTHTTAQLEAWNPNLIGGDVAGGLMSPRQLLLRPGYRGYATSDPTLFLCSSYTPPSGGVHGMCGYHAACQALKDT